MAIRLTRKEFEQEFGMTVEQWLAQQNGTRVTQNESSGKKSFTDNPPQETIDAIKRITGRQASTQPEQEQQERLVPVERVEGLDNPDDLPTDARLRRNFLAGVPAVAAGLPALTAIGRTLPMAAYETFTGDAGFWDNVAEEMFGEQGLEQLDKMLTNARDLYALKNPHATKEELSQFVREYAKSDDYINKMRSLMPADFQMMNSIQDFANRMAGMNLRAENMSAMDDVVQAISGAFVGLPAKAMGSIGSIITRTVGAKIADNLAAKIAARTVEAVTPMTLPLTPGNIALNAGVAAGLQEGIRYSQDDETVIPYEKIADVVLQNPVEAASGALAAGLSILTPSAAIKAASRQASKNASEGLDEFSRKLGTGAPLSEQNQTDFKPVLSETDGLIDDVSMVQRVAQQFGADRDTQDALEYALLTGTYTRRVELMNNLYNYGEMDFGNRTIALQDIERMFRSVKGGPENLNTYLFAVSRQQDTNLQMQNMVKQLHDATTNLALVERSGNEAQIRAAREALDKLRAQHRAMLTDDPSTRPSLSQLTRSDVDEIVRRGDAIPEYKAVRDAITKYGNDVLEWLVREGGLTAEEFNTLRASRELYFPLRERALPKHSGLARRALLYGKKLTNSAKVHLDDAGVGTLGSMIGRNLDIRDTGKVDLPMDVMSSLKRMTADIVSEVAANRSRKEVVNIFTSLPGAEGRIIRAHEFRSGNKSTKYVSKKQLHRAVQNNEVNPDDYFIVADGDKVSLWQFSDEALNNFMKFRPNFTIPILNASRKMYQQGMTGLARPTFSLVQMLRDTGLGSFTRPSHRSFGIMDTALHRALDGTALGALMKNVYDPTSFIAVPAQIPVQLYRRFQRAMSHKIYSDLAADNGIFSLMAQTPEGRAWITNIADKMAAAFDQSAYGLMTRYVSSSFGHMNEIGKIFDDFDLSGKRSIGVVRSALNFWKALVESVQMSARVSYWSQNLGNLIHKYGSVGAIPKKEMDRLALDVRNFTGDMSRRSKSRVVQGITSAVPYSNTILQGTRHFLSAATPNVARDVLNATAGTNFVRRQDNNFWPLFIQGMLMPKLAGMAVLALWPEAEQWWYQNTPTWRQATHMLIPQPRAIIHKMTTGEWPKGDPSDYFMQLPVTPEFLSVTMMFEQGVRASGILGTSGVPIPGWGETIKHVVEELAGVPTPPVIGVSMALFGEGAPFDRGTRLGGVNSDKVNPHSNLDKWVYDVIGSIFGTAGRNWADALMVGEISLRDGEKVSESLSKIFETWQANERQGLPAMNPLYDAQERKFAMTPEAEYVYKTQRQMKQVFDQLTLERDFSGDAASLRGMNDTNMPKMIKSPVLKAAAQLVYDTMNKKGEYKKAGEHYSYVRSYIAHLDRVKLPPHQYHKRKNELTVGLQRIRSKQAQILRDVEEEIRTLVGSRFEQEFGVPFSFEKLSDLIRKDVRR